MTCERDFRLVMRDPAMRTPEIDAWLQECEDTMQPLVDRALALMYLDLGVYGALQRSVEDYVKEVMADAHPDL